MAEPVERDSRGILHPGAGLRRFRLRRLAPSPPVARFVDRYWLASWSLPDGERYEQDVLVHPVVNVVLDRAGATVPGGTAAVGVPPQRYLRGAARSG